MPIIKLFLSLFSFMLFAFTNRKRLMQVLYMQFLAIQVLTRTIEQRNIRPEFQPHEKHIIAALFEKTKHARKFFSLVSPETVLRAWKNAVARYWAHKHKRKPGRPPLLKAVKDLIVQMKLENRLWGSRRIRDELLKLSFNVSHETISKIINRSRKNGGIKPTLSWKRFLSSHWQTLFACDCLTVTIFGMVTIYVFFIIKLETREIIQFGVTANPNRLFLRNQFTEFEYKHPGSTLIHDNSNELKWFPYEQYNFKHVSIVPYSPDMNAYAERFVRSIRQECLNHFIIFTQGQLRRIVKSYIGYYNNYRPHQGLQGIPGGPPEPSSTTGAIRKKPLVFGLHNHYYREAA